MKFKLWLAITGIGLLIASHFHSITTTNTVTWTGCLSNQTLQDTKCTPWAILTTDIKTLCVSGYTSTVRNVPESERKQVFQEYGIPYSQASWYEVDHLISLELGGSNDIKNLWPESYSIQQGARVKDQVEDYLHRQICNGKMSATEAQKEISSGWTKVVIK